MTPDRNLNLSRRLAATKGFTWIPGMRTTQGHRVLRVSDGVITLDSIQSWVDDAYCCYAEHESATADSMLPDLTDIATVGCVRQLILGLYGPNAICIFVPESEGWVVCEAADSFHGGGWVTWAKTEIEALTSVLEEVYAREC